MAIVRFYLDENVQLAVAEQLRRHGVDVVTVRDLDALGDEDINHLARATTMERVLCTHDSDYYVLASSGITHAGIVIGQASQHQIGDWVKGLLLIHAVYSAEEMQNRVEHL
jgi:predicted nuclease of predicted toxin-antitoxin system